MHDQTNAVTHDVKPYHKRSILYKMMQYSIIQFNVAPYDIKASNNQVTGLGTTFTRAIMINAKHCDVQVMVKMFIFKKIEPMQRCLKCELFAS